jgi:hypothetical protein
MRECGCGLADWRRRLWRFSFERFWPAGPRTFVSRSRTHEGGLHMRSLILAISAVLVGVGPAYATLVGFSFSGTWGGALGPIAAGDTISGSLTWDDSSTTNVCPGSPTFTICRPLLSLTLTETPNTDGLSIHSPADANVLFAGALYTGGSGDVFGGIQINDRSASCTTLSPSCFGTFFIGPSSAAFSDFNFDSFIFTTRYTSSGPSPVPEPCVTAMLIAGAAVIAVAYRRRQGINPE